MSHRTKQQESRREMFCRLARYLVLGGISLVSAGLIIREVVLPCEGRRRGPLGCRDCAARARCKLPPALTAEKWK